MGCSAIKKEEVETRLKTWEVRMMEGGLLICEFWPEQ
jgi:hypothetical protein